MEIILSLSKGRITPNDAMIQLSNISWGGGLIRVEVIKQQRISIGWSTR